MLKLSKYNLFNLVSAMTLVWAFAGCQNQEEVATPSKSKGYSVMAEIEDYGSLSTRVVRTSSGDRWVYSNFQEGDVVGFYSSQGNINPSEKYPAPGFYNVPMAYNNAFKSFANFEIEYNTDDFFQGSSFFYFPWKENIDYDPGHDFYNGDDYGMELREVCDDGVTRCIDFLWVQHPSDPISSQRYTHAFASIIFLRGEGFDKPHNDKKQIKVVLEKAVSHLTLDDSPSEPTYLKNIKLVYLDGYSVTEDECKEWYAWPGEKYEVNEKDNPYNGVFEEPYYIVLPTTRGGDRLNVDHIEIFDNDGILRTITNFSLYTSGSNQKILQNGQRYPLVIKIEKLQPAVVPISIVPWNKEELIKEERATGISTIEDFNEWVLNYNSFIKDGLTSNGNVEEVLLKYGDETQTSGGVKWKFYLSGNLDFSEKSNYYSFDKFNDTLEGNGFSITGLKSNIIKELGENGRLENIKFQGINVTSEANEAIGGVMGTCKGTIINCDFDGFVSSTAGVGLIAASASNAFVKGCTLHGLIIGTSTLSSPKGMFASIEGTCQFIGNNTSGLIFQIFQQK